MAKRIFQIKKIPIRIRMQVQQYSKHYLNKTYLYQASIKITLRKRL